MTYSQTSPSQNLADRTVLDRVAARGRLEGLLFELEVEQVFVNRGPESIEAVYTFPLPGDAVILGLDVVLGERRLSGVVAPSAEAEETYETAVEQGDAPVLLERAGRGLYTVNIGRLLPGESLTVHLRYAELMRLRARSLRLTVPTVIAPRYGDPLGGGLAPHQVPGVDMAASYPFSIDVVLAGAVAGAQVGSPSHRIAVSAEGETRRVTLAEGAALDRDFVLQLEGLEASPLALTARDGEGCVALVSHAPESAAAGDQPLALKILVDCSGSMAGDSIAAARRGLLRLLGALRPADQVSLSRFGTTTEHLLPRLAPAGEDTITAATRAVAALEADLGGTELERALEAVLALDARPADLLLISDGSVWQVEAIIERARRSGQRIFVVGVGSAPAEGLLGDLARATGGAAAFAAPNEDVEAAVMRLFALLRAPAITGFAVRWPQPPAWSEAPQGGLYEGETIHAFAGFDLPATGEAELSWRHGDDGAPRRVTVPLPREPAAADTLPRLAAARRLPHLAGAPRRELALRYQLVTDETALVLVHMREGDDKPTELPALRRVPQMLAAGWHGLGSVRRMATSIHPLIHPLPASPAPAASASRPAAAISRLSSGLRELFSPRPGLQGMTSSRFTPLAFVEALDEAYQAGRFAKGALPTTIAALERLGLPRPVVAALTAMRDEGFPEAAVVEMFLVMLADVAREIGASRQLRRQLRLAGQRKGGPSTLAERMANAIGPVSAESWDRGRPASP